VTIAPVVLVAWLPVSGSLTAPSVTARTIHWYVVAGARPETASDVEFAAIWETNSKLTPSVARHTAYPTSLVALSAQPASYRARITCEKLRSRSVARASGVNV
jgi:hypothetical protein